MKQKFNFVNIAGGVYTDVTDTMIILPYSSAASQVGFLLLAKFFISHNI